MDKKSQPPHHQSNLIELTTQNFDQVLHDHEIVVIDFWAKWCVPCQNLLTTIQEIASQFPQIVFAKVNVEEQPQLAEEFAIRSVPYLLVLRARVAVYAEAGLIPKAGLVDLCQQTIDLDLQELLAVKDQQIEE